MQFHLVFDVKW